MTETAGAPPGRGAPGAPPGRGARGLLLAAGPGAPPGRGARAPPGRLQGALGSCLHPPLPLPAGGLGGDTVIEEPGSTRLIIEVLFYI